MAKQTNNIKMVSVKFKMDVYRKIVEYAEDTGIDSVSTLIRSIVMKDIKEKGYITQSNKSKKKK